MKGALIAFYQGVLGTIYVPPEEDSSGGFLFWQNVGSMATVTDSRCVLHAEPSLRKRTCAHPPKYLRIPNALRLND